MPSKEWAKSIHNHAPYNPQICQTLSVIQLATNTSLWSSSFQTNELCSHGWFLAFGKYDPVTKDANATDFYLYDIIVLQESPGFLEDTHPGWCAGHYRRIRRDGRACEDKSVNHLWSLLHRGKRMDLLWLIKLRICDGEKITSFLISTLCITSPLTRVVNRAPSPFL
jgi:hypothetical protein